MNPESLNSCTISTNLAQIKTFAQIKRFYYTAVFKTLSTMQVDNKHSNIVNHFDQRNELKSEPRWGAQRVLCGNMNPSNAYSN